MSHRYLADIYTQMQQLVLIMSRNSLLSVLVFVRCSFLLSTKRFSISSFHTEHSAHMHSFPNLSQTASRHVCSGSLWKICGVSGSTVYLCGALNRTYPTYLSVCLILIYILYVCNQATSFDGVVPSGSLPLYF